MNAPAELRLPPHSIEAEQSVLGGLLLSNAAWDRISSLLTAEDFYRDEHRHIFRALQGILDRGQPADAVTVAEALDTAGESDRTGGLAYLGELAANTPSAANIRRYAEIVRERAMRRRLVEAAVEIEALAHGGGDVVEAIDQAQGLLAPLADAGARGTGPRNLRDVLSDAITQIHDAFQRGGKFLGLATGFADLDARLGGMHPGDLIIVAGRPSMGKSTIALNIAENVAVDGGVAAFFSLEMSDTQLAMRSLARFGGIPLDALRNARLTNEQFSRISAAIGRLHIAPLEIDQSGGLTVGQIHARARAIKRRRGRLDLLCVDYMGLIRPPSSKTAGTRNDEVSLISAALKAMAKDLRCPVVCLSQLNRGVEARTDKRPMMSDLRDSGSIEQDADVIVLMYRDEYYNQASPRRGLAEAIVAKHRNGEPGTVNLVFEGQFCRFSDIDQVSVQEVEAREREAIRNKPSSRGFL